MTTTHSSQSTHQNTTDFSDFARFSEKVRHILQQDILALLNHAALPSPLKDACYYAMTGNGKRVRPLLVASSYYTTLNFLNSAELVSTSFDNTTGHTYPNTHQQTADSPLLNTACRRAMLAVELLHTYSLIHDDLPCMDDDDLRRGRATCHIKYDEATALLAGDVLQTLAFEAMISPIEGLGTECEPLADKLTTHLLKVFTPCARRMVAGQMLDLNAESMVINQTELEAIHQDKTGALIEASVIMGGLCALGGALDNIHTQTICDLSNDYEKNQHTLHVLKQFAAKIGLAFQVQDDVLDVTATTDDLGKPAGSDEALNKSTYVRLMGVADANAYAHSLFVHANDLIYQHFNGYTPLNALADWLYFRKK